jgi:2-alkenal reductase
MMKKTYPFLAIGIIVILFLSACSVADRIPRQAVQQISKQLDALQTAIGPTQTPGQAMVSQNQVSPNLVAPTATQAPLAVTQPTPMPADSTINIVNPALSIPGSISDYEVTLENIYAQVSPSVVNIQVLQQGGTPPDLPPGHPPIPPQFGESLGSGFIWDAQGNIVTNNNVVEGADKISVTFSNGDIYPAQIVGSDPYSDLAVIKVEAPDALLKPVTLADSKQVKVGQITIAIGTPFGLQGSMTVGIVSALGRSLPVDQGSLNGNGYQIPDIIQTDAAINPGNSGGVLVDTRGQVIGVTFAIQSLTSSNSGIAFVIPSVIVSKVVPALISTGSYQHAWLGITGISLDPELAQAMRLPREQRGALLEEITVGGPADQAGLVGSTSTITINGQDVLIGGDVIIALDNKEIKSLDDVIAYLATDASPGEKLKVTILRDGRQQDIDVVLGVRPATQP